MVGRGVSDGPDSRPLDETIAETGPGLADEAVAEGQLRPGELDAQVEAQARALRAKGWTGACGHADDTEAHPS